MPIVMSIGLGARRMILIEPITFGTCGMLTDIAGHPPALSFPGSLIVTLTPVTGKGWLGGSMTICRTPP